MIITTFDIEAYQWTHPIGIGFYDGTDYELFEPIGALDKFLKFITEYGYKKKERVFVYSHYGGKYDMVFLARYFLRNKIDVRIDTIHSRILRIKYKNIEFRDSFCMLPDSLARLGESFGYPKLHIDNYDFDKHGLNNEEKEYLKNDCVILWKILNDFMNMMGLEYLPITFPSFALHRFLEIEGLKYKDIRLSDKKNEYAYQSYFASRSEILKMRDNDINIYDINSLFPYAMLNSMPVPFIDKGVWLNTTNKGILYKGEGIAECEIEIFKNFIPPVPYRRKDGKIIFPVGKWQGMYTFPMLRYVLDNNYGNVKITRCLHFSESKKIFNKYVNHFYKMKRSDKITGAKRQIAKYLLNGLYGKFGEKNERIRLLIQPDNTPDTVKFILDKGARLLSPRLDVWQYNIKDVYIPHRNVVLSSYITSYAMIELHKALIQNKDKVCYCDTDSMHIAGKAQNINVGKEIGEWKHEGTYDNGVWVLPKLYFLEKGNVYSVKAKGFGKGYRPKSITDLGQKTFKVFPSFKEFLRMGQLRMVTVKKGIRSTYDKRLVTGDITEPLTIGG